MSGMIWCPEKCVDQSVFWYHQFFTIWFGSTNGMDFCWKCFLFQSTAGVIPLFVTILIEGDPERTSSGFLLVGVCSGMVVKGFHLKRFCEVGEEERKKRKKQKHNKNKAGGSNPIFRKKGKRVPSKNSQKGYGERKVFRQRLWPLRWIWTKKIAKMVWPLNGSDGKTAKKMITRWAQNLQHRWWSEGGSKNKNFFSGAARWVSEIFFCWCYHVGRPPNGWAAYAMQKIEWKMIDLLSPLREGLFMAIFDC